MQGRVPRTRPSQCVFKEQLPQRWVAELQALPCLLASLLPVSSSGLDQAGSSHATSQLCDVGQLTFSLSLSFPIWKMEMGIPTLYGS